ncbi:MAG: ABC transporter ATP-binding protein [Clostridiaceae bacterium]|nr:ABC transporter ATP-binding protein [Clostridiaceae bacterium]
MNQILEINKLTKRYDNYTLNELSFSVPQGYIMGFIGPNGAGKTTTIKSIMKMVHPDSGEIKVFGESLSDSNEYNDRIGYVMDNPFYCESWTVQGVEKAVRGFYKHWDSKVYADYISRFQLEPTKTVKALSRGMKVKLMLAVALSHGAELLILDEPTSGLDPVAREEVCDILREFITDEKKGVIFSTHITSDLEKVADYITFILNGRLIYTGPRDELIESYVRVAGAQKALNEALREKIIGLRDHGVGFEGLMRREDIAMLSSDVEAESTTLEEIIVFMNKGEKNNG